MRVKFVLTRFYITSKLATFLLKCRLKVKVILVKKDPGETRVLIYLRGTNLYFEDPLPANLPY